MISPDFVRRMIGVYRTPHQSSAYRPESAAWCAPCPHCHIDADWWSGKTTAGLEYRMACPLCGEVAWTASRVAP